MKILYDFHIFCLHEYGGISRYFNELATCLANDKTITVKVLAPLYINAYLKNNHKLTVYGMNIYNFPYTRRLYCGINNMISYFYSKIDSKTDIFHETYYNSVNTCPINAKHILTIHDMIPELLSEDNFDIKKSNKYHAVQKADHIICVSENTKKDLIKLFCVPDEKVSVVHHGNDFGFNEILGAPVDTFDKPFVIFVGKRNGYKNFKGFAYAFSLSPYLKGNFNIICFGGGDFTSEELGFINMYGLTGKVKFMAGSDSFLAQLYASAIAMIYPSIYEGFGMPILEAMSYGCPVICSNTSSLPEVAGNAAEFFNPMDTLQMKNVLESVLMSEPKREELILLGKVNVSRFSWEKCARETRAVYSSVLK